MGNTKVKYLGDNLELLALAEVGLGDGLLETVDGLLVKFLGFFVSSGSRQYKSAQSETGSAEYRGMYLSAGDVEVDLTTVSTHQSRKLLADTLQQTQTVVLSKGLEEVLDNVTLVTGKLLELLDDLGLVGGSQGGSGDETGQLAVGLEGLAENGEGLGGLLKVGGLGGGSELFVVIWLVTGVPA